MKPKVGIIHSFYRRNSVSGENLAVDDISQITRNLGCDVELWSLESETYLNKPLQMAKLAASQIVSSRGTQDGFKEFVASCDVIQIHNSFPILGKAELEILASSGKPIVRFLHNYRPSCLSGFHHRAGASCDKCSLTKGFSSGIQHKCYNNSMSYSAIVAAHTKSVWEMLNSVKASLVVPSQFLADYAARASLGGGKTFLIPNSVVVSEQVFAEQVGCLYVGRLSVEKGLGLILDAWASNPSLPVLQIAGEGPLEELVAQAAKSDPRIKFHGRVSPAQMANVWASASVLLCPSLWDEPFGRVAAEAMGYGLVVVTTGNGGLAEVVGANGFAKAIEPTAEAIALAVADFENRNLTALRLQAKHRYLQNFSPSAVSASWESAYKEIIANHPSSNIA